MPNSGIGAFLSASEFDGKKLFHLVNASGWVLLIFGDNFYRLLIFWALILLITNFLAKL